MTLPLEFPYAPMEAESAPDLPTGAVWQYEPKWDGFRCLAFRDGDAVRIQSKAGKPLARYFPDVVESLQRARSRTVRGRRRDRDPGRWPALVRRAAAAGPSGSQPRPHAGRGASGAAGRVRSAGRPRGRALVGLPLEQRRARLEAFAERYFPRDRSIVLSQATRRAATARSWLAGGGDGDLDGVVAKRLDLPYRTGARDGMVKVKRQRTADCVVGGFRYGSRGGGIGSLLLGLYDGEGLLHHVGFCSSLSAGERKGLRAKLEPLRKAPGFTGRAPGGPSRWSTERSAQWEPLAPKLVVEVGYDHVSNGRFRHGTKFVRWRPDKAPRQCTMEQLR